MGGGLRRVIFDWTCLIDLLECFETMVGLSYASFVVQIFFLLHQSLLQSFVPFLLELLFICEQFLYILGPMPDDRKLIIELFSFFVKFPFKVFGIDILQLFEHCEIVLHVEDKRNTSIFDQVQNHRQQMFGCPHNIFLIAEFF